AILGIGGALIFGTMLFLKTDRGKRTKDRFFLRMPLIGDVVRYAVIERFCRIISAMMKAGVPLPEAMQAAIEGANNKVYEDGLIKVREQMLEGEGISGPIIQSQLFPPAATQMLKVGEETGTLDAQLDSAAAF